jgi:hypothetical protein
MMTMTTTSKQVGYAYASSSTASRLGFYKTGCYFCRLLIADGRGWSLRDRGFATEQESLDYAETLPEPYHFFSTKPDGAQSWLQVTA